MRKNLWTRLGVVIFAGSLLASCGDNILAGGDDDPTIDASLIDSSEPIDMMVDPDAMIDTYTGTITVLEVGVFGAGAQLGQGIQVAASFFENALAPVYEEMPGSILGCKVWEYTPTQAADVGLDEGAITVTIDNTANPAFDPEIPACSFVPTRGYLCVDTTSTGPAVVERVINPASPTTCIPNLITVTDVDAPFTFAATDGRYLSFIGSGSPFLPDGTTLPVLPTPGPVPPFAPSTTSFVYVAHPAVTGTDCTSGGAFPHTIPVTGATTSLGGVGPIPGFDNGASDQPGFLANDADVTVTLTAGGGQNIPTFTADFDPPAGPGDDFTFLAASVPVFGNLPLGGAAFTIGCDPAQAGCGTGTGDGVVLSITTTDADVSAASLTTMPPPVTKRVSMRCAALAATSVTVPAEAAAFLTVASSGATKVQSTFIRGELGGGGDGVTSSVNVVTGHATTTFKVVTECNDGVDNADDDTDVDFPADTGCTAAGDTTED
jgi:hypothetical protein